MKRLSSKAKAKFGVIGGAVALGTSSVMAAVTPVDLTAVQTGLDAGSNQINSFVPVVLGFVIIMVVAGALIKLAKRGA